jgi:hypothetical protein
VALFELCGEKSWHKGEECTSGNKGLFGQSSTGFEKLSGLTGWRTTRPQLTLSAEPEEGKMTSRLTSM